MALRKPTILVVTEDPEPSQAISAWLREAGLCVIGCPGPQPRATFVPGDVANHARSPLVATWSFSTSGWPATPCCRGTPAMQLLSSYQDLGRRWWPCNASAALLAFVGGGVELVPWPPTQRALLGATPRVASARQAPIGR